MSLKSRVGNNNHRARQLLLENNLHEHDIKFMLDYFYGTCAYCSIDLTNDTFWIDHIIPLSEENEDVINFGTTLFNIVPSCSNCNMHKGNKNWIQWIRDTFDDSEEIIFKIVEYQIVCGIDEVIS